MDHSYFYPLPLDPRQLQQLEICDFEIMHIEHYANWDSIFPEWCFQCRYFGVHLEGCSIFIWRWLFLDDKLWVLFGESSDHRFILTPLSREVGTVVGCFLKGHVGQRILSLRKQERQIRTLSRFLSLWRWTTSSQYQADYWSLYK